MLRREFLAGVFGLWGFWKIEEPKKGTPVYKRESPTESTQQLIHQIRFLEQGAGSKAHIQAIQDQIRMRLLLNGLACVYVEKNGQSYVCALETSTGCLWCLPLNQAAQPWAVKEWKRLGLGRLESQALSRACDI